MGETLNPYNDVRRSTAIDRPTSNYNGAKEKLSKIRDLINMGKYDAENYYVNPNNIHIWFPIKILEKSNNSADLDTNMITANNFFAHWVKEIIITRYGIDK